MNALIEKILIINRYKFDDLDQIWIKYSPNYIHKVILYEDYMDMIQMYCYRKDDIEKVRFYDTGIIKFTAIELMTYIKTMVMNLE